MRMRTQKQPGNDGNPNYQLYISDICTCGSKTELLNDIVISVGGLGWGMMTEEIICCQKGQIIHNFIERYRDGQSASHR